MRRPGFLAWLGCISVLASHLLLAQSAGGYRIAGRVVNADSGAPLARVEVAILSVVQGVARDPADTPISRPGRRSRRPSLPSALEAATTDEDGGFVFENLPAGKYSLRGSRRGFITASYQEHGLYSTAIVTGPGTSSERLTLRLSPGASISGSVLDTGGDPLEQLHVSLYHLSDDGLGNIRAYQSTTADDLGAYEFAHLPPGTYFVSATARAWYARSSAGASQPSDASGTPAPVHNLDVVYPRAFYADATDADAATPIPVRGGEHLRIDLHMQAVPAVHLTYTTAANGPSGLRAFAGPLNLTQSVFGNPDAVPSVGMYVTGCGDGKGSMTTTLSVAPGEYEAEIGGRSFSIRAGGDLVLDPEAGMPATEISGKLGPAAGATLPPFVSLTLEPAGRQRGQSLSTVAHDGVFHFDQVRPGAYEIGAQAQGQTMAVIEAAAKGAPLTGQVLQVGSQPVTLAATIAPASAILAGFARSPVAEHAGATELDASASGAMIVLVPQHLGDHALYRRDQADSDGSFTLGQIAAGRYTLVAIENGWDLEWARPEVIAHYLPGGQAVTIPGVNSSVVHLEKPVMVQAR